MEVINLLSQAVLEVSSCVSQQSSPRRPTTTVVLMSLPQKPEGLLPPANTSSHAGIDEGEASLEDIPSNISLIAAVSECNSSSASMDLAELQTNANKALDDLLSTKGSIDTRRWRAVWDVGMMLCQNESQVAATVKEARVLHSQMALDIQTASSQSILEARTSYLIVVKEAKTTRSHLLQEAKATCSKTIHEAKAQKISQAAMLHQEHGKYMQDLEEQAMGEESRSHTNFLTDCQVILYSSPPPLKSALAALYHILLGQTPPLPPLVSHRGPPVWKNNQPLPFHPHPCSNNLQGPKDDTLCRSHGQHAYRQCHSKGHFGRTSQPQEMRDPTLGHNTQTQLC